MVVLSIPKKVNGKDHDCGAHIISQMQIYGTTLSANISRLENGQWLKFEHNTLSEHVTGFNSSNHYLMSHKLKRKRKMDL